MTPIINLHNIVIKSSSNPHDDLPSDMKMFAQLIVDGNILVQTVPAELAADQKSWKLTFDCKVPQQALSFSVAIMRHSSSQGIRLLGSIEIGRGEILTSVQQKSRFCLELMKVNPDGPSLTLTAGFSISDSSTTPSRFNANEFAQNQVNSLNGQMIRPGLVQIKDDTDNQVQVDSLDLWVMHERILLLSNTDENRALFLNILGNICLKCYQTSGVVAYLNQAVCAYDDALRDGLTGAPSLGDLGIALLYRFEWLSSLSDLNKSILMFEDAARLTPDGHPDKPRTLNNLGISLFRRSERLGDLSDLKNSILMLENAVQLTPDGHPDKPERLSNLGNSLLDHFERLGNLSDLNKSMLMFEDAVRLTPDGHPNKLATLLNLGNSLFRR
ncbi:hypothetical protein K438DRAFT_2122014, partial [Mycena galopus ATCC 62051]